MASNNCDKTADASNRCDESVTTPVRRIGPTRRSVSGVYPFRGESSVTFESTLERDFLIRAEFSAVVTRVVSQPVEVPFKGSDGRALVYTPDFLVYRRAAGESSSIAPELVEVKPRAKWTKHWREWSPKWKAARRLARKRGWCFRIHDESRIRDQSFHNVHFLQRYGRMHFVSEESDAVVATVAEMGTVPFHYLLARHFVTREGTAVGTAHLWHLLATRRLDCDITRPLGDFTELWVGEHG